MGMRGIGGSAGAGGVRIALDDNAAGAVKGAANAAGGGTTTVTPDIAVGDDDVLHVVWFNPDDNQVRHKCILADDWDDVTSTGWDQDEDGANVASGMYVYRIEAGDFIDYRKMLLVR